MPCYFVFSSSDISYSFSGSVGAGSGVSFTSEGDGRITGVRVWEDQLSLHQGVNIKIYIISFIHSCSKKNTEGKKIMDHICLCIYDGTLFPPPFFRFQLRYGFTWTPVYGQKRDVEHEWLLFPNETIVQVSGKYHPSHYIYELIFATNKCRMFKVGQPTGTSFNFYPEEGQLELKLISGRENGNGLTAIAAHWGVSMKPANIYFKNVHNGTLSQNLP